MNFRLTLTPCGGSVGQLLCSKVAPQTSTLESVEANHSEPPLKEWVVLPLPEGGASIQIIWNVCCLRHLPTLHLLIQSFI